MKSNGAVLLEVQLDTQILRKGMLSADNLGKIMEETSEALSATASDLLGALNSVMLSFNNLITSLALVSTEMRELTSALKEQTSSPVSVTDIISNLLSVVALVLEHKTIGEALKPIATFLASTGGAGAASAGSSGAGAGAGAGAAAGGLSAGPILAIFAVVALTVAAIVQNFDTIKTRFNELWEEHIKPIWDRIVLFAENLKTVWDTAIMPIIGWVYQVLEPIIMTVLYGIIDAIEVVASFVKLIVIGVIDVVDGIIQFVVGLLTGDWEQMWDGIVKIIRGTLEIIWGFFTVLINGCAWIINTVISAIYSLIAGVVNAVSGVLSAVGNWFGLDWGGWYMEPMHEPFVPYLAKGAVLPANKPFLAMVGDQRHGTNVEAPLATIQEAVAQVMENQFSGMMAGFEASVAVQKQILQAVLGIEVGDTVIGQAANRYNRRMAIIKGGM